MQTRQKPLRYLSHAFSAPVFAMPVFIALGLIENASAFDLSLCILFATVVPIIGIVEFARSKRLDYDIPVRSARMLPFVIAIVSYLLGFLFLMVSRAPVLLSGLMLAYLNNTTMMFLVTLYWKISVHAAGVTGPLSFIVYRLGAIWGLLYLIVVPVGLIRLRLEQHTTLQILAGAVISAALTWAQLIFLVPVIPS